MATWRDGTSTSRTGSVLESTVLAELAGGASSVINPAYGDDSTDATTHFQGCLTAASTEGHGVVLVPPGTYRLSGTLTRPSGVYLLGLGLPRLKWTSDLGANVYAVTQDNTDDNLIDGGFVGLRFLGPGSLSLVMGTAPSSMKGVRLGSRSVMDRCIVEGGFRDGICLTGDHIGIVNSRSSNNYNNLYLGAQPVAATGNHYLFSVSLTGASMSSIGMHPENGFVESSLTGVHTGFAPYCIQRESGTIGSNDIFYNSTFNGSMESFGNMAILGRNSGDRIVGLEFDPGVMTQSNTYKYTTGEPSIEAVITVPQIIRLKAAQHVNNVWNVAGTGGYIKASNQIIDSNLGRIAETTLSNTIQMVTSTSTINGGVECFGDSDQKCEVKVTSGAVALGDILCRYDEWVVLKNDGATANFSGFAVHAADNAENVVMATRGKCSARVATAVTNGDLLKPDAANLGCVKTATGWTDGPIVGTALESGSTGTIAIYATL